MSSICIVNNFNYGRFLDDCLTSLEQQTVSFDRVLIVDDGSNDGGQEVIRRFCEKNIHWIFHQKTNGGQLSCFNTAVRYVNDEDVVCLLDSDDVYPPDYLEVLLTKHGSKVDFLFCKAAPFKDGVELPRNACTSTQPDVWFGISSALTRRTRCWIGSPTSAISMSGSTFKLILPFAFEKDWVTRADDVLVLGASISGARKLYCPSISVGYRIHGSNLAFGKTLSREELIRRDFVLERLFFAMSNRFGVPLQAKTSQVIDEYRLFPAEFRAMFGISENVRDLLFPNLRAGWRGLRKAITFYRKRNRDVLN
jgi:glycosyltransferase involved in cell wall biosynthesis